MTPRYVAHPRLSWVPEAYVVIDGRTGKILSKHAREEIAQVTAEAMNHARR